MNDKISKRGSVASTENLKSKRKSSAESPTRNKYGLKKPTIGGRQNYAAKMLENRKILFKNKYKANLSYLSKTNDKSNQLPASTAKVRSNNNYKKNLLSNNDQDSTSINDSESDSNPRKVLLSN